MLLGSTSLGAVLSLLVALPGAGTDPVQDAKPSIVPQVSIRGIALGMTPSEVRSAAGRPARWYVRPSPILGKVRIWRYHGLRVTFDSVRAGRTVIAVTSTSRRDKTAEGVGVGSSEAKVRRSVAGARCRNRYGYRSCTVGGSRAGQTVTDFAITRSRRVSRATLARVID